ATAAAAASTTAAVATAAAATATAASAAAAIATTATASAATATRAILSRLGFVHGELTPIVFLAVKRRDRGLCFGIAAHLHKSETLAPAGVTIGDDLGRLNRSVRGKKLFQV